MDLEKQYLESHGFSPAEEFCIISGPEIWDFLKFGESFEVWPIEDEEGMSLFGPDAIVVPKYLVFAMALKKGGFSNA